jgi:hypothetical protein
VIYTIFAYLPDDALSTDPRLILPISQGKCLPFSSWCVRSNFSHLLSFTSSNLLIASKNIQRTQSLVHVFFSDRRWIEGRSQPQMSVGEGSNCRIYVQNKLEVRPSGGMVPQKIFLVLGSTKCYFMHLNIFYDHLKATDLVYYFYVINENITRLRPPTRSFSSVLEKLQKLRYPV